ncbi:MAG: hypothetical protein ACTHU0_05945 [Kofleriaceae bacterium]
MRTILLALILAIAGVGCGGAGPGASRTTGSAATPASARWEFPAVRWLPARPSYAVAARSVRDAQQVLGDLLHLAGPLSGLDLAQVARQLGVDPGSPDGLAALGLDLDGGIAIYADAVHPTLVVQLAAPARTRARHDHLSTAGRPPVARDGVEVVEVALPAGFRARLAITGDWLWVHVVVPFVPDDGLDWLTASRPAAARWPDERAWLAETGATAHSRLAGLVDLRGVLAGAWPRAGAAVACTALVEPIGRVGATNEGDPGRLLVRLTGELGGAAPAVRAAILPAPAGWGTTARAAPLAAQWNVDLVGLRGWLAPCLRAAGAELDELASSGVRTARAIVERFDPDRPTSSRGAVALDLAHRRFFSAQLDVIPLRSKLERKRAFGPYAGHSISIPFGPTVEYVLTDSLLLAGIGEGAIVRALGSGAPSHATAAVPGPLLALELAPPAMSQRAWAGLLELAGVASPQPIAEALSGWTDLHLSLTLDGSRLVLEAAGSRRQSMPTRPDPR